jgi:zinc protease
MKKAAHEGLKQSRASAESVANRVADTVVNGFQHPFGRVTVEKDIDAVQTSWCRDFHAAAIKPQGAILFVVGDVEQKTIEQLFKTHLAAWKGAPAPLKEIQAPSPAAGNLFFVDVPNSVQSVIYFMDLAPPRLDKSYLPLQVASRVLGGGFASRINMNLREDKGYSYGASGYVNYSLTFGYFRAGSSVRADSSLQSLHELNKEIQELTQGIRPVSAEELQREKNAMVLSLPARFGTSRQAMGSYQELIDYGLPLDYYATLPDMVAALTPEDVAKTALTQIKAEQMKIFIVGDAKSPLIERVPAKDGEAAKDAPMMKDGKATTLLDALRDYAKDKGGLVLLDADGKPIDKKT